MSQDGREFVRVAKVLEFEYTSGGRATRARVEDLSEGGAFVATEEPLPEGDEIEFKLTLPGGEDAIHGRAVVVWRQRAIGMGVRFVGLSNDQRVRINFHVAAEFFKSFSSTS